VIVNSNLWAVLLGAAIASLVPLLTLRAEGQKWKVEKRVENLRLKHERLEKMYENVLEQLSEAFKANAYPSTMSGKIAAHTSKEFRDLYFCYVLDKARDPQGLSQLYLKLCLEAQKHLADIQGEIDKALT
jgi:hypothetical protein